MKMNFFIIYLICCYLHLSICDDTNVSNLDSSLVGVKPNTTVCYDLVGCFDNNQPFNNSAFYLPISPQKLNTKFRLFTNLNNYTKEFISYSDEFSIKKSKYNNQYPFKIIIHGFQNSGETVWVNDMVQNLLIAENEKLNIITVDWRYGAIFPFYYNASANTRLVGRQTCLLVKAIRKLYYENIWSSKFNIHCIGHSLGAQTCGYASADCDSMFDRITALDPAGPNFENYDSKVRIDPSDAKFVDAMHTNGDNLITGNFGMFKPCGHVDFYPNGGKQQPGCQNLQSLFGGALLSNPFSAMGSISCSHGRAVDYFIESIKNKNSFLGYPCDTIENFEKGNCLDCTTGGCSIMGYYTNENIRGIKYLLTNSSAPFGSDLYTIDIKINESNVKSAGELGLIIQSNSINQTIYLTKKSDEIISDNLIKKIFVPTFDLKLIEQSFIFFNKKQKPLFGIDPYSSKIYLSYIKISNYDYSNHETYSNCNLNQLIIEDKQVVPFDFMNINNCEII